MAETVDLHAPLEPAPDQVIEEPVAAPVEPVTEEAPPEPPVEGEDTHVHPLAPGGDRFRQVWARAKKAEAERQVEREARIRAEAERDALRQATQPKPATSERVYTWAELQRAIDEQKITLAEAMEYREKYLSKQFEERESKLRTELTSARDETNKVAVMDQELGRYLKVVPEINQPGSQHREALEREFAYQCELHGYADPAALTTRQRLAMNLSAVRAVLGPIETLERKSTMAPTRSTHQETTAGTSRPTTPGKDLLSALSADEKAHYTKMIDLGRYKDWSEVKTELEWYAKLPTGKSGGKRLVGV